VFGRLDWTVNGNNRVTGSAHGVRAETTRLDTFNPQSVTPDIRNHNVLGMISTGSSQQRRARDPRRREAVRFDHLSEPGQRADGLAPDVNAGSYFNDQDRTAAGSSVDDYAFAPLGPAHTCEGWRRRHLRDV